MLLEDLMFRLNTAAGNCENKNENLVNVIVQLTKIIKNPLTEDDVQHVSRIVIVKIKNKNCPKITN